MLEQSFKVSIDTAHARYLSNAIVRNRRSVGGVGATIWALLATKLLLAAPGSTVTLAGVAAGDCYD